jgi:hypothetical protein
MTAQVRPESELYVDLADNLGGIPRSRTRFGETVGMDEHIPARQLAFVGAAGVLEVTLWFCIAC